VVVRKYAAERATHGLDLAVIQHQLARRRKLSRPTVAPDAQTALDQLTTRANAIAWAANYPLLVKTIEAVARKSDRQ
jgi:hypothetical protein